MKRRLVALVSISLLLLASELLAKGKTTKIVIASGDLAKPVEISDPDTLVSFQVWAGPGTSANQAQGFIVDWSSGAIKELPEGLTRYEISFYVNEHKERIAYVVLYAFDSSTGRGYVYIPGKSDPHFQSNVRTIFRGVEGSWFHAWTLWDSVAEPLITKARPAAFEGHPPQPKSNANKPGVEKAVQTSIMLGERFMDSDEIERLVRANVDKTVTVVDVDGEIQNLFVHSVDEEGFVCDIAAEMTQPPTCAYWVRFTDVREVHPAGDGPVKK